MSESNTQEVQGRDKLIRNTVQHNLESASREVCQCKHSSQWEAVLDRGGPGQEAVQVGTLE